MVIKYFCSLPVLPCAFTVLVFLRSSLEVDVSGFLFFPVCTLQDSGVLFE